MLRLAALWSPCGGCNTLASASIVCSCNLYTNNAVNNVVLAVAIPMCLRFVRVQVCITFWVALYGSPDASTRTRSQGQEKIQSSLKYLAVGETDFDFGLLMNLRMFIEEE